MKEILFKAKRKGREDGSDYISPYKNGDWVYGLVSKQYKGHWAEEFDDEMTDENGVSGITIDRNTICEYTGCEDEQGTRIFEGDIVLKKGDTGRYFIIYDRGMFVCVSVENYVVLKTYPVFDDIEKVVGTIYDDVGVGVKDDDR